MPWNFVYNGTLDTSADGDKCLPWNSADLRFAAIPPRALHTRSRIFLMCPEFEAATE